MSTPGTNSTNDCTASHRREQGRRRRSQKSLRPRVLLLIQRYWGQGRPFELEAANLRRATVTIGMLAGHALVHVQERRSRAEKPPVEPARVDAGHEDGAKCGQPDLAAMVVAREHQVHAPVAGPVELVGRVAQQDPEIGRGNRARQERRSPGRRGAAHGQPRTVVFQRAPVPLERCEPGIGQPPRTRWG